MQGGVALNLLNIAGSMVARLSCFCSFHNSLLFSIALKMFLIYLAHSLPDILASTRQELSDSRSLIVPQGLEKMTDVDFSRRATKNVLPVVLHYILD